MPASKSGIEETSYAKASILLGFLVLLFDLLFGFFYWPNLIGTFLDLAAVLIVGAIAVWGAISIFRYDTRKYVLPDEVLELARAEVAAIPTRGFNIKEVAQAASLSADDRKALDIAKRVKPGTEGFDQAVPEGIRALGGIDADFYHSKQGGQQGFVKESGRMCIEFPSAIINPYVCVEVDHSRLDTEIIGKLTGDLYDETYRPNRSVVRLPIVLHPKMVEWCLGNIDGQSVMLQGIGFPRLNGMFMERWRADMARQRAVDLSQVELPMKQLGALLGFVERAAKAAPGDGAPVEEAMAVGRFLRDVEAAMSTAARLSVNGRIIPYDVGSHVEESFKNWLLNQPQLQLAMGYGKDNMFTWMQRALTLQAELTKVTVGKQMKEDEIHTRNALDLQRATRQLLIAGGSTGEGAAFQAAGQAPRTNQPGK